MLRRPGLPAVDPNLPQPLREFLQAVKENIEIANGVRSAGRQVGSGVGFAGWSRRSVTLGMLVSSGLLTEAQAKNLYEASI